MIILWVWEQTKPQGCEPHGGVETREAAWQHLALAVGTMTAELDPPLGVLTRIDGVVGPKELADVESRPVRSLHHHCAVCQCLRLVLTQEAALLYSRSF